MTKKIGYVWHLRRVMADHGMFATTELMPQLAERGITLSREQVYRLVTRTPQRLNLSVLVALCDILHCQTTDLIEPVIAAGARQNGKPESAPVASTSLRPRRARVLPAPAQ
jgi:DNA-binding Xre family transcriptional regulator